MKKETKKIIIDWNHIDKHLSEEEKEELKGYYLTYHRKCWCYKKALRKLKKYKMCANTASVLFASGGIISSIVTHGIALAGISVVSLLIHSWMGYKNLEMKIYFCDYSYKSYQHLLNQIKEAMRVGTYNRDSLINEMKRIDDIVADHAVPIDKFHELYEKKFI